MAALYGNANATLPGMKLVRIANGLPFIMHGQPAAVAKMLGAFLK